MGCTAAGGIGIQLNITVYENADIAGAQGIVGALQVAIQQQGALGSVITGEKVQSGYDIAVFKEPLVHILHIGGFGNCLSLGDGLLAFGMVLGGISFEYEINIAVVADGQVFCVEAVANADGIKVAVCAGVLASVGGDNHIVRITGHTHQGNIRLRNDQADQIVLGSHFRVGIIVCPVYIRGKIDHSGVLFGAGLCRSNSILQGLKLVGAVFCKGLVYIQSAFGKHDGAALILNGLRLICAHFDSAQNSAAQEEHHCS